MNASSASASDSYTHIARSYEFDAARTSDVQRRRLLKRKAASARRLAIRMRQRENISKA